MNKSVNSNSNQYKPGADLSERKEFKLSTFSIRNRISVLVLLILFVVLGVRAYVTIPKESAPDITIPNILVITTYPGVSPEDVENLVTRKIEDELSNVSDYKKMTSTTLEGYSSINMEFNSDVNIEEALQKVREKVDLAKPELPSDVDEPVIEEINISEFPIMQVNISGDYSLDRLKAVAEDLQDIIETIPQVLEVDLAGGIEKEVKVDVNLPKLKYYGISFEDVITAIQNENITIPGGTVDVGTKKFLVRVPGEYDIPKPIEDIVVTAPDDKPVYIRDIATVTFGEKERESYAFLNQSPVITLSVKKRTGQNIIETSEAVRTIVEEELPNLPPTTNIEITSDQSKDIRMMVSSLENNIISGLFLVIGVLLFFLGVRNSSFVGISIPVSMFISFIILQALGITMNMIVLFSLILALGMLVDNAIVVVENIYRYLEEGYNNIEAAKKGTGEVALPIISGTATTLAAFLPMIFWPGMVGEFMSFLPKTLIITLGSSLFVGLVINPVLCAVFMKLETDATGDTRAAISRNGKIFLGSIGLVFLAAALFANWKTTAMLFLSAFIIILSHEYLLKPIGEKWQKNGMQKILDKYEKMLEWSLSHRLTVIGMAAGILISSFVIFRIFNYGVVFFPEDIPPKRLYAQIETPAGTNVDFTRKFVEETEDRINQIPNTGDVESFVATAGAVISNSMEGAGGNVENRGTVVLNFVDYQEREGSTLEAMEVMRETFPTGLAGAKITIEKEQEGPPTGKPINMEISGKDMGVLTRLSDEALRILENDPVFAKLDGLESDLPESRPEVTITVDREKASLFGLNTADVGNTIRQAINGVEASKYRDGNDEYDITVRLAEDFRKDVSMLAELNVMAEEGRQIPLSEIASWRVDESFGGIKRKNQKRVITISADVRSNFNSNAVLAEVQEVLQDFTENLPAGYSNDWTGQQQEQEDAQDFLVDAFFIALSLMAFILISQFNSVAKPFIVLTSVIMSVAGVLYGLLLFQMPFGIIMTGIGVISLAGVVVNNAIVMIDYIDILRERDKMPLYDALVRGGIVRFRPVILTAITTTLGLVPLAIGFNIDFFVLVNSPVEFFTNIGQYLYWGGEQAAWWSPMAIAVICGLLFATVLTLILVPVMYFVIEDCRGRVNKFFFNTEKPAIIEDPATVNGKPVQGQKEGEIHEHQQVQE